MSNEIKNLIQKFDHIKWLESEHIDYTESGSNLGKNWIGVCFPFCPDGDDGYHLGINKTHKGINCWRCKTKGTIAKLILKYNLDLKQTLENFQGGAPHKIIQTANKIYAQTCHLPKRAKTIILPQHKKYLLSRGYNPTELFNEYKLLSVGVDVEWGYRLIIPFYYRKKLLTFIGRDVSDAAKIRYKAEHIEKSVVDAKGTIFNIDSTEDSLILVEGAFDAMRIGKGCGSINGTELDDRQIHMIAQKKIKNVFILFDNDEPGRQAAEKYGAALNSFTCTHIMQLPEYASDPGELLPEDVKILRKEVFGKIY